MVESSWPYLHSAEPRCEVNGGEPPMPPVPWIITAGINQFFRQQGACSTLDGWLPGRWLS